jgi:hypothetical protein
MVNQSSPSRSTRLLLESGTLAADSVARLVGARDLVVSRALCRFRRYRAPQTLSKRQVTLAARAYAEAHAPFADTGTLVLRAPGGAAIWYWDRSKLAVLQPLREVSPESVWRETQDGWRIVACAEGYEAQYAEAGALVASTWRRQAFTAAQWAAFTLSVESPAFEPPAEPPAPVTLPLANGSWRDRVIKEPLGWRDLERAGVTAAICVAAVAALFVGQALRSDQIAQREQANAARIEQDLRGNRDVTRALEHSRVVRAYAVASEGPAVLTAVTEAHEILARFGLQAPTWRASAEGVSFIVDAAISETPVRDIVAAMEEAPHLCGAVPEIAGQGRFEIRAAIASDGNACPEPRA